MKIIKVKPNSKDEALFMKLLKENGVRQNLLIKKEGIIFGESYDEYQLSDGLFNLIKDRLSNSLRNSR